MITKQDLKSKICQVLNCTFKEIEIDFNGKVTIIKILIENGFSYLLLKDLSHLLCTNDIIFESELDRTYGLKTTNYLIVKSPIKVRPLNAEELQTYQENMVDHLEEMMRIQSDFMDKIFKSDFQTLLNDK